jgi:hypothetical protein
MKHRIELDVELESYNLDKTKPRVVVKSCLFQFRHGRFVFNGSLPEAALDLLDEVLDEPALQPFEQWLAEGNEDA